MAAKAAVSLQASVAALGPGLLDWQVLNDVAVEDLLQYLGLTNPPWAAGKVGSSTGEGGRAPAAGAGGRTAGTAGQQEQEQDGWHLPLKAQRRLACIASCVAAVSLVCGVRPSGEWASQMLIIWWTNSEDWQQSLTH
jgi:hypothetical protein